MAPTISFNSSSIKNKKMTADRMTKPTAAKANRQVKAGKHRTEKSKDCVQAKTTERRAEHDAMKPNSGPPKATVSDNERKLEPTVDAAAKPEEVSILTDQKIIAREVTAKDLPNPQTTAVSPDDYLAQLVEAAYGIKLKIRKAQDIVDYFPADNEERYAAYNVQVVTATRENNVDTLKDLYRNGGQPMDCANRFGESILHNACRRGFADIVSFLLDEVALNVRVCDDCGRTPMHDACWHPSPLIEICTWIIQRDPSLLLIADKRGHTPFQYARPGDWAQWRSFLFDNRHCFKAFLSEEFVKYFST